MNFAFHRVLLSDEVKENESRVRNSMHRRNIEARSRNHCSLGKAINITYSECVSVTLVIQYAKRMRRVILSSVGCLAVTWDLCFWDITQRRVVILYRCCGTTYWPNLQRSRSPWASWPLKMGPIGCPETSVRNYHYMLYNIPEERRFHLHRGGGLKSRVAVPYFSTLSHKRHYFRKKLNVKCILIFSTIFIWKISHSKKHSAQ